MKVIIFSITVLTTATLLAQGMFEADRTNMITDLLDPSQANSSLLYERTREFEDIEGSPYYHDEFNPGFIIDRTGQRFDNLEIKYLAYGKQQLVIKNKGKEALIDCKLLSKFSYSLNGEPIHFYYDNGVVQNIWSSEKYYLVKRVHIEVVKKPEPIGGYGEASPPEFEQKEIYSLNGFEFKKLGKQSLKKAFPDLDIKGLLKELRIDVTEEVGFIEFLQNIPEV